MGGPLYFSANVHTFGEMTASEPARKLIKSNPIVHFGTERA